MNDEDIKRFVIWCLGSAAVGFAVCGSLALLGWLFK